MEGWGAFAVAALGGGTVGAVVNAVLTFIGRRPMRHARAMADEMAGMHAGFEALGKEVGRLNAEVDKCRLAHEGCQAALERSWVEQDLLNRRIEDLERRNL